MGMEDFMDALDRAKAVNGKIIGEDGDFIKSELAEDDKQAWVNHMVEQHLRNETIDVPPPNFEITMKDFVKEISKREINKIFGKK